MFNLEALQSDGTWYAWDAPFATHAAATAAMHRKGGYLRGTVKYRIVKV